MKSNQIWDLPTRLFHWLLVIAIIGGFISEKFNAMDLHRQFGITIGGLLVFRLMWGIIGARHSRFTAFFPTPKRLKLYIEGKWTAEGHNPFGALAVLLLLGILMIQVATGLFSNDDSTFFGPLAELINKEISDRLTHVHRFLEYLILGWIIVHLIAISIHVWIKKHPIIRPMITGGKSHSESMDKKYLGGAFALILSISIAIFVTYIMTGSWISKPQPLAVTSTPNF
ncbi:cytochrome b/b6 domain-containing protein [Aquirhabdus parva]|uniref:cytochrome b/b6 domain-containing protein n=1 Tax=Aquirhabdus parva TaxID=2283318 RepID=UPI0013B42A9C|nr:cytochrome b/b6 domain-containing protein [Aquirhabdus parva]